MELSEKLLYSKKEAAEMLSLSIATFEMAVRRGMLRVVHKGRRVLVRKEDLAAFAKRDSGPIWPPKLIDTEGVAHTTRELPEERMVR